MDNLTNKEIVTSINEIVDKSMGEIVDILAVNYNPHPFTIGSEHIGRYSLDTNKPCSGYVDDNGNYSNKSKKGFHKCGLPLDAHTYDKALVIKLSRNVTDEEFKNEFMRVDEAFRTKHNLKEDEQVIDGFIFLETEEKFRIIPCKPQDHLN